MYLWRDVGDGLCLVILLNVGQFVAMYCVDLALCMASKSILVPNVYSSKSSFL